MSRITTLLAVVVLAASASYCPAQEAAPLSALAKMPVKEVTVFKDGHAFVLHEGEMPTDATGSVQMDYLPTPVLGTFWPYSAQGDARLTSVVAGRRRVLVERKALSLRELLEANPGAKVHVTEDSNTNYEATIVGIPAMTGEERDAVSPPGSEESPTAKGNVIFLKTITGTKVVDIGRIRDVTFLDPHRSDLSQEEFRNLLTLKLDWGGAQPGKAAKVGMAYVQKGLRWIPEYRIDIDGAGKAAIKLQASLVNELTDLEDATVHLVIGVPTFAFEDHLDPISLQKQMTQLSEYFRRDARTAYAMSNAIMSQMAMPQGRPAEGAAAPDLGPEVGGAGGNEDLFVFTIEHVTLRKGQRMVLPVVEFPLEYRDVYTLDVPFTPPVEVRRSFDSQRMAEMAKLHHAAKVQHVLRLTNTSKYPLTTAPVLILRQGRVLAQGMMKYTAVGGGTDLAITTAVDVNVKKTDKETKRTPNAVTWNGDQYGRIDLVGEISITNHRDHAIELKVVRNVLGNVEQADNDGKVEMVNVFEDASFGGPSAGPYWWGWYSWPYWWHHFNGVGRITWKLTLESGQSIVLGYTWDYYWR